MSTRTRSDLAVGDLQVERQHARGRSRSASVAWRQMPWSWTYLATQRTPLPHISASDPSALNIRMRASATSDRADQNQAVAADAEMPVGDPPGQSRPDVGHRLSKQSTYT